MNLAIFLEYGLALKLVREVDVALLQLIQQQQPDSITDAVSLAILLASKQSALGHACVDLTQLHHAPLDYFAVPDPSTLAMDKRQACAEVMDFISHAFAKLDMSAWLADIATCHGIAVAAEQGLPATPLVLQQKASKALLYLRRYWQCEQQLLTFIDARLKRQLHLPDQAKHYIQQLFASDDMVTDWQRVAVALAARSGFAIITGGPGTGKTTTVLRMLALLQAMQLELGLQPLHIKLAAPTGKAAARLNESIAGNLQGQIFPSSDVYDEQQLRNSIPTQVTTLHRLLGSIPNSRQFRHHQENPLAADVVVVDEASMVDVEMMAALVQALDSHTRLILIGDKDQLASVEAGSVLGDLCHQAVKGHYLPTTLDWLKEFTGDLVAAEYLDSEGSALSQATAMLRVSHRFKQGGAIHALASLVNEGLYQGQPTLWPMEDLSTIVAQEQALAQKQKRQPQLHLMPQSHKPDSDLQSYLVDGYRPYLQLVDKGAGELCSDAWGQQVLQLQSRFQLLVALRQGVWGLAAMNEIIQSWLQQAQLVQSQVGDWYPGRPVMVTRNDYHLKLMNGDIGVCLPYPDESAANGYRLRVVFSDGQGGVRWVLPSRLRAVETVYAMTVHKSQGSEFEHTLLMLPDQPNPVFTKELLYTGITRAKSKFTLIFANQQVLAEAMQKRVERVSGLIDLLKYSILLILLIENKFLVIENWHAGAQIERSITMSEHTVNIQWTNQPHPENAEDYNRNHHLLIENQVLGMSAASDFLGDPEMADPEQVFVGSIAGCHMLFFLAIARIKKFPVASYEDRATAVLGKNEDGAMAVTKVVLRPKVTFVDAEPSAEVLEKIHHSAHKKCFIANSIKSEVVIETQT